MLVVEKTKLHFFQNGGQLPLGTIEPGKALGALSSTSWFASLKTFSGN
jgi:hypothetical protein